MLFLTGLDIFQIFFSVNLQGMVKKRVFIRFLKVFESKKNLKKSLQGVGSLID